MSARLLIFFYTVLGVAGFFILGYQLHLFRLLSESQRWVATPAIVLHVEQKTVRSNGAGGLRERPMARIKTRYRYNWNGRIFEGDRLEFSRAADNFSGSRRSRQLRTLDEWNQQVFVNPRNPAESVYDRSAPIEQIAFGSFFILMPCAPGILFLLSLPGKLAARIFGKGHAGTGMIQTFGSWLKLSVFAVSPLYALLFLTDSLTLGSAAIFILVLGIAVSARLFLLWIERLLPRQPGADPLPRSAERGPTAASSSL